MNTLHQGAIKWGFHNYADRMAGDLTFATNMYDQGGTATVPPLHSSLEIRDGQLVVREDRIKGKAAQGKGQTQGKASGQGMPQAGKGKGKEEGKTGKSSSPSPATMGSWQQWSSWPAPTWTPSQQQWSPQSRGTSSWGSQSWSSGWR